jgi:ABC-type Na+ efflux pump permease subunit
VRRGFLGAAWFIASRDTAYLLRRRETVLWVFVMPILFFYFIGTVTAGLGGSRSSQRDPLAVRGGENGGFLVDELVRRLEAQAFAVTRPASHEAFATATRRLTIPAPAAPHRSFTDAVLAGVPQTLTLERRGESSNANYDQVRVARAVYEVLGDLVVVKAAGQQPGPGSFAALHAMPRALSVAVRPAGKRRDPPTGFSQAIPGTMVMFTMLVVLTSGAISLVVERRQGLLRRLASAPMSAGSVVFGKWLGRMMLGLAQIAFAMAAGTLLFDMDWGRTWPVVCAVLVAWAALTASLAIVLASLTRTEAQTAGIAVLSTQVLAALGGCWWPIEITPPWMQTLARAVPTGWAMDAMHKLINFADPPSSVIPHLAVMVVASLALGWLGTRTFRYQ